VTRVVSPVGVRVLSARIVGSTDDHDGNEETTVAQQVARNLIQADRMPAEGKGVADVMPRAASFRADLLPLAVTCLADSRLTTPNA
jgi:hypothetical protein